MPSARKPPAPPTEPLERPDISVACGGCRACCTGTNVSLFLGDDIEAYKHKVRLADLDPDQNEFYRLADPGFTGWILRRDPATDTCVYMSETVCSIYDRRPINCRSYSCLDTVRRIFSIPKEERDGYRQITESRIFREGLARLHDELFPEHNKDQNPQT